MEQIYSHMQNFVDDDIIQEKLLTQEDLNIMSVTSAKYADPLRRWSDHYYRIINDCLRKEQSMPRYIFRLICSIIEALDESPPIDHDYMVARGIREEYQYDKGFASKAIHLTACCDFVNNGEGTIMICKYPKGSKQLYVDMCGVMESCNEDEVISYPGEKWEIEKTITMESGHNILFLKYMGFDFDLTKLTIDPTIDNAIDVYILKVLNRIRRAKFFVYKSDEETTCYCVGSDANERISQLNESITSRKMERKMFCNGLELSFLYDFLFQCVYFNKKFSIIVASEHFLNKIIFNKKHSVYDMKLNAICGLYNDMDEIEYDNIS